MKGISRMLPEEMKAAVRRAFDGAFNKGNLAALDQVFTPDMTDHSIALAAGQVGLEGFKKRITRHRTGVPDLQFTIEDILVEGDKLSMRWTMGGTQDGPWLGRPATGKTFTITGMNMERFAGDKIVEHWSNPDVFSAMQQLGFIPTPGQGGR
jgi:predicted ester cyclase